MEVYDHLCNADPRLSLRGDKGKSVAQSCLARPCCFSGNWHYNSCVELRRFEEGIFVSEHDSLQYADAHAHTLRILGSCRHFSPRKEEEERIWVRIPNKYCNLNFQNSTLAVTDKKLFLVQFSLASQCGHNSPTAPLTPQSFSVHSNTKNVFKIILNSSLR